MSNIQNLSKRCIEYAEKGLFGMLAEHLKVEKSSIESDLSALNETVTDTVKRDKAYQVVTENICTLANIADIPSLKRHRLASNATAALRETVMLLIESQAKLSEKEVAGDILNESFSMENCLFLNEANPYITHFKNEIKIHPKAKGSMKNLTHDERKQFFKDVAVKWHAKKKEAAGKEATDRQIKIDNHKKEDLNISEGSHDIAMAALNKRIETLEDQADGLDVKGNPESKKKASQIREKIKELKEDVSILNEKTKGNLEALKKSGKMKTFEKGTDKVVDKDKDKKDDEKD